MVFPEASTAFCNHRPDKLNAKQLHDARAHTRDLPPCHPTASPSDRVISLTA